MAISSFLFKERCFQSDTAVVFVMNL